MPFWKFNIFFPENRRRKNEEIDQISENEPNSQKCQLLGKQLGNIKYTGGGTFTMGALLEAFVSTFPKLLFQYYYLSVQL